MLTDIRYALDQLRPILAPTGGHHPLPMGAVHANAVVDRVQRAFDALERLEEAAKRPNPYLEALRLCHEYFKACALAYEGETHNGIPVSNAEQLETVVNRAGEAVMAIADAEGWK